MTKVGDTLHKLDHNRRVYRASGQGGPIFGEHFIAFKITGETPKSWLVTEYEKSNPTRVNKIEMRSSDHWGGYKWYTTEEKWHAIWIHDNRHKLEELVGKCDDVTKLKAIAVLLKYNEV